MRRSFLCSTVLCFIFAACHQPAAQPDEQDGLAAFSADSLKQHVAVLASDAFMGRKPFTEGETKTVNYLKQQYAIAGLEPGNGNSYFQDVPMVNISTIAAPSMQVASPQGNFTFKGFDDYVVWTEKTDPLVTLSNTELVFAGYGVVAPEYNWNDYAGLDVKGKVVLVMVNDPGYNSGDTTLFKGKTMTYYGRWTYKFEEAARQGAKGCLIIHNTAGASYPFSVVQNNWNGSRLHLDNRGKNIPYCDLVGWVTGSSANRLLAAAGLDSTILAGADQRGFKGRSMQVRISTSIQVKSVYNLSHNVIGKITGTTRKEEYIIYSAHWDHLGVGQPDETGDSIYNGALDNASATAGLLELARAFNNLKTKPERTIVFLAVTAEEQGLWGSAYYAQNPVYPAAKTVANINMDEINAFDKTNDIVVVGKGQSDLEDILQEEAEKAGRYVSYESHPEAGYYYRSDHFNFAKAGIPALYTNMGIDVVGKGKAYGQQKEDEFTEKHYHRPSDEFDPATWTMAGGMEDLKLMFQVGKRLAWGAATPGWKTGSEFKAVREKK